MRNPTIIPDYKAFYARDHKKFDYNFTSLPGDDADRSIKRPVGSAPARITQAQDSFDTSAPKFSMADKPKAVVCETSKPKASPTRPRPPHCIIS